MTGPGWGSGPWSPPWGRPGNGSPPVPTGRLPRPVTPPGVPPHDVPQPHALLMRTRDWAWWRPLLGLLLLAVLYSVAAFVVVILALLTGATPDLALTDLTDPAVLLITNASLIVAVPIVWTCWAVAHGMRIGWSSSVLGRLRWRLILPWTLRALPTLGLAVAATVVLPLAAGGVHVSGPDASVVGLVLVVLLTTPLQSAAEEYVFRGYLSQAIAGWIGHRAAGPVVAAVVTAALFSAAHAPPDWPTFLYRFAMGLALSAVVWLTGGLEAAIVLHAVNNVVLFLLAGLLGDAAVSAQSTAVIDGISMLLGVLGMAGFVAWVAVSRRSLRPELAGPASPSPIPSPIPFPFPAPHPPSRSSAPPPDDRWARPSEGP
jgi:membrane protease YdiL (CAAX protease family)